MSFSNFDLLQALALENGSTESISYRRCFERFGVWPTVGAWVKNISSAWGVGQTLEECLGCGSDTGSVPGLWFRHRSSAWVVSQPRIVTDFDQCLSCACGVGQKT